VRRARFAASFALLVCGPAFAADPDVPPPESITLVGAIANPGSVTQEELAHMPPVEVTVSQETDKGPSEGKYRGVLLWTLIDRAGLVNGTDKNAYLRHTILVSGADGYAAALGEGEIDPKLEGKQVIVAYMKDGKLLDGMQLVVPGDAHAARGVHDIAIIEVK